MTQDELCHAGVPEAATNCVWVYNCLHEWICDEEEEDPCQMFKKSVSLATFSAEYEPSMRKASLDFSSSQTLSGRAVDDVDDLLLFLMSGGIAFFDELGTVVSVHVAGDAHANTVVQFGPRQEMDKEAAEKLSADERWSVMPHNIYAPG